jgi:hypothetical protein
MASYDLSTSEGLLKKIIEPDELLLVVFLLSTHELSLLGMENGFGVRGWGGQTSNASQIPLGNVIGDALIPRTNSALQKVKRRTVRPEDSVVDEDWMRY